MKKLIQLLSKIYKKATLTFLTQLKCFLVPFLALAFVNFLPAQESKVWDYPVHYGTSEWEKLSSFQERLKVYNIPDSLLQYMTTEDLVETCLTYPEWLLITSSSSFQTGYNSIKSVFNGFVELEKRPDAYRELIKVYQEMNPEKVPQYSDQGNYTFQFTFIELLISQRDILSNLTKSELISLIKTSLLVYEKKCNVVNVFSMFGLSTTCLILGRVLEQGNTEGFLSLKTTSPEFQYFIENGRFGPNKIFLDKIIVASKDYLKQLDL